MIGPLPQFVDQRRKLCHGCPHAERVRVSGSFSVTLKSRCNAHRRKESLWTMIQTPELGCPDGRFEATTAPDGWHPGDLSIEGGKIAGWDRNARNTPLIGGCGGCGR